MVGQAPESAFEAVLRAADALAALACSGEPSREDVDRALREPARLLGSDEAARRLALRCYGRDARFLELPPAEGLDAYLRLVVHLGPFDEASIWIRDAAGGVTCAGKGSVAPVPEDARTAAQRTLDDPGDGRPRREGVVVSTPIFRLGTIFAALVARLREDEGSRFDPAAVHELTHPLGAILERAELLDRAHERERVLVGVTERRLARLTLDLHDGPLQDVAALLSDMRLFRRQLAGSADQLEHGEVLTNRIDDLEARLVALYDDLRGFAESFESHGASEDDLRGALEREVAELRDRAGVTGTLVVDVDEETMTPSQRIAIVRIVREGLANVREHSGARNVELGLRREDGNVRLRISDDGVGFDVDATVRAARRLGRLGLAGMEERVRLLGGTFEIDSTPGRGTTISVLLPDWRPLPDR